MSGPSYALRPRALTRTLALIGAAVASILLVFAYGEWTAAGGPLWQLFLLVLLFSFAPLLAYGWLRAKIFDPTQIELLPDQIKIVRRAVGSISLPYRDLVVCLRRRVGDQTFLVLGTERRRWAIAEAQFVAPGAMEAVVSGIEDRFHAWVPQGAARWQAFRAAEAKLDAEALRPCHATHTYLFVLVLLFVLQGELGTRAVDAPFALVRLGAASRFLLSQGEWERLLSANWFHVNEFHLLLNFLAIHSLGQIVERLLGARWFVITVVVAGVAGTTASALAQSGVRGIFGSVGASTAAFGLLGALAWINWRHRRALDPRYRPSARWWIFVLVLNGALPLIVPVIDGAGHLGGFVGGLLVAALGMRGRPRPPWGDSLRRSGGVLAAGLLLVAGVALSVSLVRFRAFEDRFDLPLVSAYLAEGDAGEAINPLVLNAAAWSVAAAESPSRAALQVGLRAAAAAVPQARIMEAQGERGCGGRPLKQGTIVRQCQDTQATLLFRQGRAREAVALEAQILRAAPEAFFATQLARFALAVDPPLEAAAGPALRVTRNRGRTFVRVDWPADATPASAYGVVLDGDEIRGLVRLSSDGDAAGVPLHRGIRWTTSATVSLRWVETGTSTPLAWGADEAALSLPGPVASPRPAAAD